MRTLAKAATSSLVTLVIALGLTVVAVAAIDILGIRFAVQQATVIAGDELTTAEVTGQLTRNMDAAYATGEAALRATVPAERSRLLRSLYTSLLPAVDTQLSSLVKLHSGDSPAEYADLELFIRQWTAVRDLLSRATDLTGPAGRGARCRADGRLPASQRPP